MDLWTNFPPKPQFKRSVYRILNENWTLNGKDVGTAWSEKTSEESLVYICDFVLDSALKNDRVRTILHFGAVDQICDVTVNGTPLAHHEGGYHPFDVDLSDIAIVGLNRLRVEVSDPLDLSFPYGKQCKKPHGMWYTPVSGIWQPVWIEAVPRKNAIRGLTITPDLKGIDLLVDTDAPSVTVSVQVPGTYADELLGMQNGQPTNVIRFDLYGKTAEPQTVPFDPGATEKKIRIDVPSPRLWTPADPFLYTLIVETDTDRVESYFALRTVTLEEAGGHTRLFLNGRPFFLYGVLDQGYYGDDMFLPADPAEYARDVERMKALGFNAIRKHIKIEHEAFYYACDRLGMLVVQDMVNSGEYSFIRDTALPTAFGNCLRDTKQKPGDETRRERFERDLKDTIALLFNHPSIVGWTVFNEGWGQFESDRLYALAKKLDPTRFVDATSGWFAQEGSDCESVHIYFRNKHLKSTKPGRFLFLSECGGFTRAVEGHTQTAKKTYGYGAAPTEDALTAKFETMVREMILPSIPNGLSGVIYTQNADVEGEINGLYTADRAVCKVDTGRMQKTAALIFGTPPYNK